ncbi:MAG: DUF4249 domain-containing protein [Bacteroidales bacterium]|nr:DUF4249 domain-containing protein [Bacteroidales bacterium]
MKRITLISLLFLALASCEKVIDFDTSVSHSEPVLNGVPSAGKQLFVYFAHSRFFLDSTNYQPINNVDMAVTINGTDYLPTMVDRCNYYFNYTVQEDDDLSIRILAEGKDIYAHTVVPRMPRISQPIAFTNDTGVFHLLIVNFNIDDYANHKDYYCITLRQRDSGCRYSPYFDRYDTIDTTYNTFFLCNDHALVDPFIATNLSVSGFSPLNQLLTTDSNIDGTNHNTTLTLIRLTDTNEVVPYIHQYTLDVETVSPERYRYLQEIANATSMLQLITEPPEIYSNVSGALGIFAGNARRTFPLITLTGGTQPPPEDH